MLRFLEDNNYNERVMEKDKWTKKLNEKRESRRMEEVKEERKRENNIIATK